MAKSVGLRHACNHGLFKLGYIGGARINRGVAVALWFLGVGSVVAARLRNLDLNLVVFLALALHICFNLSYFVEK